MFFYISLFAFMLILLIIEEQLSPKLRPYCTILMLLVLGCVTGFRSIGGTDFDVYKTVYNNTPYFVDYIANYWHLHDVYFLFNMEKGYIGYISFIKTFLGLSFYGYIFLQSIIIYTLLYKGLSKYTNHFGILVLMFLYKMFFYETFISMRQPLTIVFFYMIMHLVYEKNALKYYLILIFVILPFHNGAILLFLVYLVSFCEITKRKIILLNCMFIPTIIVAEFGIDPLSAFSFLLDSLSDLTIKDKALGYLANEEGLSLFHTLEYLFVMFLLILNYDKIINSNKYAPFIVKLFLILLPIMTLFRYSMLFRREVDYFVPTYAFILGYICDIYKARRWMVLVGIVLVSFYGYIRYIIFFDGGVMLPYRSWLEIYDASFFN